MKSVKQATVNCEPWNREPEWLYNFFAFFALFVVKKHEKVFQKRIEAMRNTTIEKDIHEQIERLLE
jgi:hypothetical protein